MQLNIQKELKKKLTVDFNLIIQKHAEIVEENVSDINQNWSSQPNKWSVAECLIHLNLSGQAWLPYIKQSILDLSKKEHEISGFKNGFFVKKFISFLSPPAKIKLGASKRFKPNNVNQLKNINTDFILQQKEFLQLIEDCESLCLQKGRVQLAIAPYVKVSLGDAFQIVLAHELRHLWQIENIISHKDFPQL
jgi:hypothetical protein